MSRQALTLTAWQRRRLRRQLRTTRDAQVYRRTLAILEIASGKPIAQVARLVGVSRRTVYYWVESYGVHHDPVDLVPEARPGRPTLWTDQRRTLLQELLSGSPTERKYEAGNWTVPLLQEELGHATGIHFSEDTIRRQLHQMGYTWKRPRYRLVPDPELEKKTADSLANSPFAAAERRAGGR